MKYEDIIDLSSAKERFMGNFGLFSRFLFQFPDRSLFGDLEEQLARGDTKTAFETAHTMKGIVANLSLKQIEAPLSTVVEALRNGMLPGEEQQAALRTAYTSTVEAIRKAQEGGTPLF